MWRPIRGVFEEMNKDKNSERSHLLWSNIHHVTNNGVKSPIDYFFLMFSNRRMMFNIVKGTNENLRAEQLEETNIGEMTKFIGIRITIALEQRSGSITETFSSEPYPNSVKEPGCYAKKFKMTRHRFQDLTTTLKLHEGEDTGK